ncbi:MAG: AraC family transcriptional regulator [Megasphaera sp.]|jgi:AraC-like DNA-binding protein|uniref:helix-turn-helix domain-containing protein n=1 Tax=Megasphaera sp. TaxID=2023260 RepID=UPI0025B84A21|nr:AraC family transcriptional regulator [Megasphaera sp.]MCF0153533.1 helix-turn-helix transcriptional regulator [Megasphaera sp.]MCI7599764.1 AraC family transcriptional regulator [Megasphaera sp.]
MIFSHPDAKLLAALDTLGSQFRNLPWNFLPTTGNTGSELVSQWLGDPDEDIMVVTFKGTHYLEKFHKQDFFFINFVVQNGYDVLSSKYDNHLHLSEGDVYIGQPYSGYALRIENPDEVIMTGLHIRKELFFREYLSVFAADTSLLHFFLEPQTNQFSDEYIRMHFPDDAEIWPLIGLMAREYANKAETTQPLLHSLMRTLTLYLSRKYAEENRTPAQDTSLAARMMLYIEAHSETVTLKDLAAHFGYHPNYISAYLHKQTGQTFSNLLLQKRMEKASLLLENTDLTIESIAEMLGYRNTSNFYKAFRDYFKTSPRNYPTTPVRTSV